MKQLNLFIGLFLFFTITISAQKVSNVSNHQEQSTIIVFYDLETKTPCKIALYVSTNGGTTWQGPLKKVSGDVGVNVSSGNKSITWSVLEEFDELIGNNILFQVRAVNNDNKLETVIIGSQEWTKKNLDVSTYRNGDIIPEVTDPTEWSKLTTGAWCYYNNNPEIGKVYGKLYNWYAVNDPRGLAPKGYHVPSDKEWMLLIDYLGGKSIAGGKMKFSGTSFWKYPNVDATNQSGFNSLPVGFRYYNGEFKSIAKNCWFWSSIIDENHAIYYLLENTSSNILEGKSSFVNGFAIRCIKD